MSDVVLVKDRDLKKRWRCSNMKLWRMRKAGKLNSIQDRRHRGLAHQ